MDLTNPPLLGATDPATVPTGTTPGCFANPPEVGGPRTYSSPDTPGMPEPSDKTAGTFFPMAGRLSVIPKGVWDMAAEPSPFVPLLQKALSPSLSWNMLDLAR